MPLLLTLLLIMLHINELFSGIRYKAKAAPSAIYDLPRWRNLPELGFLLSSPVIQTPAERAVVSTHYHFW